MTNCAILFAPQISIFILMHAGQISNTRIKSWLFLFNLATIQCHINIMQLIPADDLGGFSVCSPESYSLGPECRWMWNVIYLFLSSWLTCDQYVCMCVTIHVHYLWLLASPIVFCRFMSWKFVACNLWYVLTICIVDINQVICGK